MSTRTIRRFGLVAASTALGIATLVSTGCGTAPGTVVDDGKRLGNLKMIESPVTQNPADPQAETKQIMADIDTLRRTTKNLKCQLTGYFVGIKDGKVGSTLSDFAFEKPNKTSIYMVKSSDAGKVGTKIVWMGGQKMAVKTKLLGFWLKVSVDVHDDRARDPRGYFIDETGIESLLYTLTDTRNKVTPQGRGTLDGMPIVKLGVVSPRSLNGIAREVFVIDTQRKIPVVREMYDKSDKLVFRIQLNRVVLNTKLPASTFQVE